MKRALKITLAFLMIAGSAGISGATSDAENRLAAPVASQWPAASAALEKIARLHFPRDYSVRAPQHGTHLCSDDDHCGTGHKCCSGHCKAVSTC